MIQQKRQTVEVLPSAVTRHVTIQEMPKAIDSHERACAQDCSCRGMFSLQANRSLALASEEEATQRREGDRDGVGSSVEWMMIRLDTTQVALSTAAIF